MNNNLIEIQNKWQKIWLDNKSFQPEVDKNKKKFFVNLTTKCVLF